ncbi:Hsp70 family protein [Nocardia salmonicida]|uniref:Hsp70 family protein n=1 Tax=Nocardia salmonicida TaxID=53431 RepID=UPI003447CE1C
MAAESLARRVAQMLGITPRSPVSEPAPFSEYSLRHRVLAMLFSANVDHVAGHALAHGADAAAEPTPAASEMTVTEGDGHRSAGDARAAQIRHSQPRIHRSDETIAAYDLGELSMKQYLFGIDLGTTFSAIAYIDAFAQPVVINNADGLPTTPSAVFFEPESGNVVVGQEAKNIAKVSADRVVTLIKAFMGETHPLGFDGRQHTPESISALVLRALAQYAEDATGTKVERVVITVPAYFGVREREATRQAGVIAGLEVVGIVTEPVAAALAYGVKFRDEHKTVLVYDLGGGTFDTTILRISPDALEVVAIDGNRKLGGAHWDERLVAHINDRFVAETGMDEDPMDDEYFSQELFEQVEKAKISLSKKEQTSVSLKYGNRRAKIDLTRDEFESVTAGLIQQTKDIVDRTLDSARAKDPGLIVGEVLLVGGSSQMPAVTAMLREHYGWEPKLSDPNLSVAKGAAIYGSMSYAARGVIEPGSEPTERYALPGAVGQTPARRITNVLPKGIGIQFVDDNGDPYVGFLAHKNAELPLRETIRATTFSDNQTEIAIRVFEQGGEVESRLVSDNVEVTPDTGAVITGLPPLPRNSAIDITVTIDAEGLVSIEAVEPDSGKKLTVTVDVSVLQADEVAAARDMVLEIMLET